MEAQFSKTVWGLNQEEVQAYIDALTEKCNEIEKEAQHFKSLSAKQKAKMSEYEQQNTNIKKLYRQAILEDREHADLLEREQNVITESTEMARELVDSAQKRSQDIIADAEKEAQRIVKQAKDSQRTSLERVESVRMSTIAEGEKIMQRANEYSHNKKLEADAMMQNTENQCNNLIAQETLRQKTQAEDFDINMTKKRAAATKEIEDRIIQSRKDAEAIVSAAQDEQNVTHAKMVKFVEEATHNMQDVKIMLNKVADKASALNTDLEVPTMETIVPSWDQEEDFNIENSATLEDRLILRKASSQPTKGESRRKV